MESNPNNYPYRGVDNALIRLKARHVEYISGYPGLREPFVALFAAAFISENAKFLLAVADYKKNPTWDKCISIYNLYVRAEQPGKIAEAQPGDKGIRVETQARVNIADAAVRDIQTMMSTRRGQVGGAGDPQIFDRAFKIVLDLSNGQVNFRQTLSDFIKGYGIDVLSESNFTRFPHLADARA